MYMQKVLGAEEVLTECSDDTTIQFLQNELQKKLQTEIHVSKNSNNEIVVQRLLID